MKKGNVTLKNVQVSWSLYKLNGAERSQHKVRVKEFFFLLECVEIMIPWYMKVSKLFTSTINHDPYTSMEIVKLS